VTGAAGVGAPAPVVGAVGPEVAVGGAVGAAGAELAPVDGVLDEGVAGVPKVFDVQAHAKLTPTMTVLSTDIVPSTRIFIRPLIMYLRPASLALCVL
jgi:hypothetical protein